MSDEHKEYKTTIYGNVGKNIFIGFVQGDVIIEGDSKHPTPTRSDETPSLVDDVFLDIRENIAMLFSEENIDDSEYELKISKIRSRINNRLSDLHELGEETDEIKAIEQYLCGIQTLLLSYQYLLSENDLDRLYRTLAQQMEEASGYFLHSGTKIGQGFSYFFSGWALIKRTKPLYSHPDKLDIVVRRHKSEIPAILDKASISFGKFPMSYFAQGEANYSMGWGYVFESLTSSLSLLQQAQCLEKASGCFGKASHFYDMARMDRNYFLLSLADKFLFLGISRILMTQRENVSDDDKRRELYKSKEFLTKSVVYFYEGGRVQIAQVVGKILLSVERELSTLQGGTIKTTQLWNDILQVRLGDGFPNTEHFREDVFAIMHLQAFYRLPKMFVNSSVFLDSISLLRKDDKEDLSNVLQQVCFLNTPAINLDETG